MAGRILLVDDNAAGAMAIERVVVKGGGFEVRHARDGAAAQSLVRDLIHMDIQMPGMSSTELLEELRKAAPDLPIAMITGHASVSYAVQAIRGRAGNFTEKPVRHDHLAAVVRDLVARAAMPGRPGIAAFSLSALTPATWRSARRAPSSATGTGGTSSRAAGAEDRSAIAGYARLA